LTRGRAAGEAAPPTLQAGCKAFWTFETTGWADATGNGHTGTGVNTPTVAAGQIGNGVNLVAASSQRLTVPAHADFGGGAEYSFTVSAWAKPATVGTMGVFGEDADGGNPRVFALFGAGVAGWRWRVHGTDLTTSALITAGAMTTNTWQHLIVNHDAVANTINMWINNVAQTPSAHTLGVYDANLAVWIGSINTLFPFNGMLDAIGYWDRLLTSDERAQLAAGTAASEWPFT
jgi:hypothetical protein